MFNFSIPNVPKVDVSVVKKAIDDKGDMYLLDVRTPQEFAKGKILNSINIPVDEISKRIEQELLDKDKTIYVYCLSGSRSVHAVDIMLKLGYSNAYDMTSGLLAWRAKGYPVAQ